jgi:hypothetical protein
MCVIARRFVRDRCRGAGDPADQPSKNFSSG